MEIHEQTNHNSFFWKSGNISLPWKNNEHRQLNYIREPYNDSSEIKKWREIGFTHEHFTGEMYDMRNPEPNWMKLSVLKTLFPYEHLSWSFYKMTTGVILPRHVDKFVRFRKIHDCSNKVIVRALIMLEDWQQGHYLDMADSPIVNWKAGDYAVWTSAVPHTAANIGWTNRYTLQLTGLIEI
jgi:hypothetical protein